MKLVDTGLLDLLLWIQFLTSFEKIVNDISGGLAHLRCFSLPLFWLVHFWRTNFLICLFWRRLWLRSNMLNYLLWFALTNLIWEQQLNSFGRPWWSFERVLNQLTCWAISGLWDLSWLLTRDLSLWQTNFRLFLGFGIWERGFWWIMKLLLLLSILADLHWFIHQTHQSLVDYFFSI